MSIHQSCGIDKCNGDGTLVRGKRVLIRGYCQRHYHSLYLYGDPLRTDNNEIAMKEKSKNIIENKGNGIYYEQYTHLGLTANDYVKIHYWIKKNYGKSFKCEKCNIKGLKKYEWANKDKKYRKIRSEWIMLCPSCHKNMDYNDALRKGVSDRMSITVYKYKDGELIDTYKSISQAAKKNKISRTAISNNVHGRSKKSGGFEWRH